MKNHRPTHASRGNAAPARRGVASPGEPTPASRTAAAGATAEKAPPSDLAAARAWLLENVHGTHVRHLLERGLEYAEAIRRAGLSTEMVEGEDLYQLLADDRTASARAELLHEPTL